MNQPKPAIEQFMERATRILNEYFTPHKYSNFANANLLANLFPLDSFVPSDQMFVTEARLRIASGQIQETSEWREAFRAFHEATGNSYRLDCNSQILEKALQGRKPTTELLMQISSDLAGQLVMTPEASAQASHDVAHEQLFHALAPKLIVGIPAGSNRYAIQIENRRIEAERQRIWNLSLEELEALAQKKNMRNMSKEELRAIVKANEPSRQQQILQGDRHAPAETSQIELFRTRGAADVKAGLVRPIPEEWKIPGKDLSVPFSNNLLAQLPPDLVRKLIQMYGNNQLTWRCLETQQRLSARK